MRAVSFVSYKGRYVAIGVISLRYFREDKGRVDGVLELFGVLLCIAIIGEVLMLSRWIVDNFYITVDKEL